MTDQMQVVPEADKIRTGVSNVADIADGITDALADTYRMVFKTHAIHWNVEGPLFHAVHTLTEGQYEDMFDAADALAERVRALGQLAPMRMDAILDRSIIEDMDDDGASTEAMVAALAQDHAAVAKRLHDVIETAEAGNDPVTADLLTARSAFHEKSAWMLRATIKS